MERSLAKTNKRFFMIFLWLLLHQVNIIKIMQFSNRQVCGRGPSLYYVRTQRWGSTENGNFPLLYVLKMSLRMEVGASREAKTSLRNIKMVPKCISCIYHTRNSSTVVLSGTIFFHLVSFFAIFDVEFTQITQMSSSPQLNGGLFKPM